MMSATTGSLDDSFLVDPSPAYASLAALEAAATLDPVANQSTAAGAPITVTLSATGPSGESFVYAIFAADGFVAPSEVDVTINQLTGAVTLTPHAGVTGAIQLRAGVRLASADDTPENYDFETFTLSVEKPTIGAVANQSMQQGAAPLAFTLTSTDPLGEGVVYDVVDPITLGPPQNVAANVNPTTGQVTLIPDEDFTGTINLRARVRSADSPDVAASYSFVDFTLQVTSSVTLEELNDVEVPGKKSVLVPLTGVDSAGNPVTYEYSTNNNNVELALVGQGSASLALNVSGTDKNGQPFSGKLTLKLFEDLAPVTTARIKELAATGFYNNKTFHRVVDGFMAQGGGNTLQTLGDEFNSLLTFTSPGLLAMANAGKDTGDAQFFITALTDNGETTPIDLEDMPEHLNFDHTIFGQLVDGFDLFQKLMTTNVAKQDTSNEISKPVNTITIVSAEVINDTQNAVLRVTPKEGFTGAAEITVTARNSSGDAETQSFTATAVADDVADPPFLGVVTDKTTTAGTPVQFQLTSTDLDGGGVVYSIVDPTTLQAPANVTVSIEQATGQVTLTPANGFTGTINLLARVRASSASANVAGNHDVEQFTLTVNASTAAKPTLGAVANQTTTAGNAVNFTLTSTDQGSGGVTYSVVDPSTLGQPANVTVVVNQNTGQVTLTPAAGFTGTVQLRARVKNTSAPDQAASYDTKDFTLTVNPASTTNPTLNTVANQTTTVGAPVTFSLSATNPTSGALDYSIVDPSTLGAPANVTVSVNDSTGAVTLTPVAGFSGTIQLRARVKLASAADTAANYSTQDFTLTVNSTSTTNPTLNAVTNKTTTVGTATTFTLTSTNPTSGALDYSIVDPSTGAAPANVTISVNDSTGAVTLTPATGFTGTINLRARVRLASAADAPANYSTQDFTLTVTATGVPAAPTSLAMAASTGGGAFDGNGYTSVLPTITLTAPTGTTVKIKRGNTVIATATETSTGSGQYRATLPAGSLGLGTNSLTAMATNSSGTSADSAALSITYAPNYSGGVYTVPGAPGASQSLTFAWTSKNAAYNNEFGYVVVNSANGAINGVAPGSPNYAQTLLSSASRRVIFSKGQGAGATTNVTLNGGQSVVFYMIQNNTTTNFLSKNPTNAPRGNNNSSAPLAFFSIPGANPDGQRHAQIIADPMSGFAQYNWEDLYSLGDSDFNDAAFTVRLASQAIVSPGAIRSPGGSGNVKLNGSLSGGMPVGDLGVYLVDTVDGKIGSLKPGDAGYAAAALASANRFVLYSPGGGGSAQVNVPAGKYLGFYGITNGTTANFLTANSTNSPSGSTMAFFSFEEANPDDASHFSWVSPGTQTANPNVMQLHVADDVGGGAFDSYMVNLQFTA